MYRPISEFNALMDQLLKKNVTIHHPLTTFIESKKNILIAANTEIMPNVFLSNVKIGSHCTIGPSVEITDTTIGSDNYIGFTTQIKRSELGNNCNIKHHCYIGDATIGNYVNIAAGVITANYDGKKKHQTIIENEVFIGCNVNLIAPIVVKYKSFIAAGSTIPSNCNIPKSHLIIARSRDMIKKRIK